MASDPIEAIKRYAPSSLKVTLADGTDKAVAVPKAGNRWARTSQVLESLNWTAIECLDKDGRLLGVVEGDDSEAVAEFDDSSGGDIALARVLLEVMRTTMKESRQLVDAQLRGNAELVSALTDGLRAQAEVYRGIMQVQRAHLMAPPGAEPSESDEVMKMFQMAMLLKGQMSPTPPPRKDEP
jgi:hypothetical protein